MAEGLTILYADDNENDVLFFKEALRRAHVEATLRILPSGDLALRYIEGAGEFSDRTTNPIPDVVFIGWRIPMPVSRAQFVERCRQSPLCADLTIVVLSGAGIQADLDEALRLGANIAIAKPGDFHELADRLKEICNSVAAKKR